MYKDLWIGIKISFHFCCFARIILDLSYIHSTNRAIPKRSPSFGPYYNGLSVARSIRQMVSWVGLACTPKPNRTRLFDLVWWVWAGSSRPYYHSSFRLLAQWMKRKRVEVEWVFMNSQKKRKKNEFPWFGSIEITCNLFYMIIQNTSYRVWIVESLVWLFPHSFQKFNYSN